MPFLTGRHIQLTDYKTDNKSDILKVSLTCRLARDWNPRLFPRMKLGDESNQSAILCVSENSLLNLRRIAGKLKETISVRLVSRGVAALPGLRYKAFCLDMFHIPPAALVCLSLKLHSHFSESLSLYGPRAHDRDSILKFIADVLVDILYPKLITVILYRTPFLRKLLLYAHLHTRRYN